MYVCVYLSLTQCGCRCYHFGFLLTWNYVILVAYFFSTSFALLSYFIVCAANWISDKLSFTAAATAVRLLALNMSLCLSFFLFTLSLGLSLSVSLYSFSTCSARTQYSCAINLYTFCFSIHFEPFIVMGLTVLKRRMHSKNLPNRIRHTIHRDELESERWLCESSRHRCGTDMSGEKKHKSAKNTLSQVIFFNEHGFFMRLKGAHKADEEKKNNNLWFLHVYDTNLTKTTTTMAMST